MYLTNEQENMLNGEEGPATAKLLELIVALGEVFSIKANYTVQSSGSLITGANCTVTWAVAYNITPIGDEFLITFNTTGLTAISTWL